MKMYHDRETTPLKFHKVFWFLLLPIDFLFACYDLHNLVSESTVFSLPDIVDLVALLSLIVLSLLCFTGFFRWRTYAWYCVIFYFCEELVYDLVFIILCSINAPTHMGEWTKEFFLALLWVVPCTLYYYKRRPLFFTDRSPS